MRNSTTRASLILVILLALTGTTTTALAQRAPNTTYPRVQPAGTCPADFESWYRQFVFEIRPGRHVFWKMQQEFEPDDATYSVAQLNDLLTNGLPKLECLHRLGLNIEVALMAQTDRLQHSETRRLVEPPRTSRNNSEEFELRLIGRAGSTEDYVVLSGAYPGELLIEESIGGDHHRIVLLGIADSEIERIRNRWTLRDHERRLDSLEQVTKRPVLDERNPPLPECSNRTNDDRWEDDLIDQDDPGCKNPDGSWNRLDNDERNPPVPVITPEPTTPSTPSIAPQPSSPWNFFAGGGLTTEGDPFITLGLRSLGFIPVGIQGLGFRGGEGTAPLWCDDCEFEYDAEYEGSQTLVGGPTYTRNGQTFGLLVGKTSWSPIDTENEIESEWVIGANALIPITDKNRGAAAQAGILSLPRAGTDTKRDIVGTIGLVWRF